MRGKVTLQHTCLIDVATPVLPTVAVRVIVEVGIRRQLHTDDTAEFAKTLKQAGLATAGAARLIAGACEDSKQELYATAVYGTADVTTDTDVTVPVIVVIVFVTVLKEVRCGDRLAGGKGLAHVTTG